MPNAIRHRDISLGHGCFPPRPNVQASSDVFINNLGAHRVGDAYPSHCCGKKCHGGAQSVGSPDVFVNGKALARVGDLISCGDHAGSTFSPDVIVN